MANCECLEGCPFFNDKMKGGSGVGKIFKKTYCLGDNTQCARHIVFKGLGKEKVPGDLFPYMYDEAKKILAIHNV